MEYQRLQPAAPLKVLASKGPSEALYWRTFRSPVFLKEFAPITSIHFVPQPSSSAVAAATAAASSTAAGPGSDGAGATSASDFVMPSSAGFSASAAERQKFAVTTGSRVQLYSMRTTRVLKTISRFGDVARSANVRADGKLIVAGDDSGLIQVFDVNSRAILRTLKGHELPVHVTKFSSNPTQILSASDDHTVRLWDMPSQSSIRTFEGHEDYVRSAVVSPDNPSLVFSGGYEGTLRLWDARMGEGNGCAMTMQHGPPVEDCLIYPTGGGGMALSVGGPMLKAWDLMMGGRCTRAVSNHTKTITALSLSLASGADSTAEGGLGGLRVLTAGLDHLVKVYDPAKNYKVTHTMRYPSPILSMAVSPDESHIAVGMADGTLCVRKRDIRAAEAEHRQRQREALGAGTYELFKDGRVGGAQGAASQAQDDVKVETLRAKRLKSYDKLLRSFRYRDALDEVLRKGVQPAVTFAMLDELRARSSADGKESALRRAIGGRDDITLEPLLRFLLRHAASPQHAALVCDTTNVVIDLYSSVLGQSPLIDDLFGRIWAKLTDELRLGRELCQVKGALEMLLAGNGLGAV